MLTAVVLAPHRLALQKRGAIMMRDLFRESADLNSRIRFTVKRSGRTLMARVKARLSAIVVRCLYSFGIGCPSHGRNVS
jgi:hypothetical protein